MLKEIGTPDKIPEFIEGVKAKKYKLMGFGHRVYRADKVLKLGPTEFRLLSIFMEKPGRVFARDQLLDRVWGRDIYVDTRTVDVHIGRLRKAITIEGVSDPIRTVRGAGYALN